MKALVLPRGDGTSESIEWIDPPDLVLDPSVKPSRLAYAAAHVAIKPVYDARESAGDQDLLNAIDWEATLAFRRYLWSLGLGVAEAMDTAQRSSLGWSVASELIARTLEAARAGSRAGKWTETIAGAGTDGLTAEESTIGELASEYIRQGRFIQERGGTVMLLASPVAARCLSGPSQYVQLYTEVCRELDGPIFLHWLGPMFDSRLEGYFPGESLFQIMERNAGVIRGVKLSLLDDAFELETRRRLRPSGQVVLTGDDYHYSKLILGEGTAAGERTLDIGGHEFPIGDFSHALLGAFDAIAPVAAKALQCLARGDEAGYTNLMAPTELLSRKIFEPPTECYKAGVVLLAYLNGHQDHFGLLDGLERRRSPEHYLEVFKLANRCGALRDPALAAERFGAVFGRD